VLAEYDGVSDLASVALNIIPLWLHVLKLPSAYRKKYIVEKLLGRVAGEIKEVEMNPVGSFQGDFVRVRNLHDVRLPVTKWVSIHMAGKRYPCEVKYEKIGQLCFACGLLGHSFKDAEME
jgi:hypothetical protein